MTDSRDSKPLVPFITTEQMREVDRLMVEEFGILLIQMMENAGRHLANLARTRFLDECPEGRQVLVLAGTSGNGGGGLVCARHLHNWGASVRVWLSVEAAKLTEVPRHQLAIVERLGIPLKVAGASAGLPAADLVIDALIGYSLRGAPSGTSAALIGAANGHGAPILALDVPSGVDAGSGTVHRPTIKATATMTLALPKQGLKDEGVKRYLGELYLADIGVPPELYSHPNIGLAVGPIFAQEEVVRLF